MNRILVTPGVDALLPLFGEEVLSALQDYYKGVYNTLDEPMEDGLPFGVYKLSPNITIWITDDPGDVTTILLPEEY